ncbi:MAG: glycosyltransferase family 39 protein [Candidatus Krumholzibacteriota bacterium]|nr:glycosyltransferase family 39 protein [Candidatus Krumholzibacteriota bacterium]
MNKGYQDRIYISETFLALVVIAVGLSLRVLHALFTARLNPLAGDLTIDASIYDQWAKSLVWGGDSVPTRLMQAPLFPWFVSLVYRAFGPSFTAVRSLQAILGACSCAFMVVVTRRLFRSSLAGILAGLALALYLPAIFYEGVFIPVTLIIFLNTLCLLLLVPEDGLPGGKRLLLAGFVLGLSVLAKPVILLLVPFILLHLIFRLRKYSGTTPDGAGKEPVESSGRRESRESAADRRRSVYPSLLAKGLILAGGILVAVIPITIRNARISGEFIPLTTGGGINFYIGNNPQATGYYAVPFFENKPIGGTPQSQLRQMYRLASAREGRRLSAGEVSGFWLREGWRYIRENPRRWAGLTYSKFLFFWNRHERSNVESLSFHRRFGGILALPLLSFGVIAPLGLLGIFLSRRRWKRLWLLYGGIITYLLSALIFYVLARYRLPVVTFLIPFAGLAAAELLKFLRDRRFTDLVLMLLFLAVLAYFVNMPIASDTPRGMANRFARLGTVYQEGGETERAREAFQRALEYDPANDTARRGLNELPPPRGRRDASPH